MTPWRSQSLLALLLQLSLCLTCLLCHCLASADQCEHNDGSVDYLIVGAGGGGIQTALFLKKYGLTYQILEQAQTAASFWTKYPVFKELISVNKRVNNETHRYRYDWHSFLETPISMWDVTQDYFPTGFDLYNYMNRVVKEADLNIRYGVEVESLAMDGKPCLTLVGGTNVCAKYRVFVATGLKEKDERYLQAIGGIKYSEVNKTIAAGKHVCVLGNGNAGFEVAQNTYSVADRVFVMGKHPVRLSAVTKYTGDVRVKLVQVMENFHGKLLDAVYEPKYPLAGIGNGLNRTQLEELKKVVGAALTVSLHECELLVLATGFRSWVPGMDLSDRRFPLMRDWYSAESNPSIHYVGWLMHQNDFRRGAGGFVSGYRYLIRNLVSHIRETDHGVPYPRHVFTEQQVLDHAVKRFQSSSDLVILQDGVVVRDAIVTVQSEEGKNEYHYYEGITYKFHQSVEQQKNVIYLYLSWGDGRSAASVFDNIYMYNDTQDLRNSKLHPVVEVNGLVREAQEDINMAWVEDMFIYPVRYFVRDAISGDYTKFYERPSFPYERMKYNRPTEARRAEIGTSRRGVIVTDLRKTVTQAIIDGGTPEALQRVRSKAQSTIPSLIFLDSTVAEASLLEESDMEECAQPGKSCGGRRSCCEGTQCIYNPGIEASFCIDSSS